jgi:hypothetical protein
MDDEHQVFVPSWGPDDFQFTAAFVGSDSEESSVFPFGRFARADQGGLCAGPADAVLPGRAGELVSHVLIMSDTISCVKHNSDLVLSGRTRP